MPAKLPWVLALCVLPFPAFADLTWTKTVQEYQCTPDDKSIDARFAFKNTGKTPVTIRELHSSCGCTTAKLDKKVYAPGESGEVVATYSFRGQTGALRKMVTVYTDQETPPVQLDIRVFRHEPFEMKPGLVYWRTGDAGEAKTVQLTANSYPVRIKKVTSSNPHFVASLEPLKEGEKYAVNVKPTTTAAKESAEITVVTDFPPAAPRTYKIQARVK
jgi:hypothetical protein